MTLVVEPEPVEPEPVEPEPVEPEASSELRRRRPSLLPTRVAGAVTDAGDTAYQLLIAPNPIMKVVRFGLAIVVFLFVIERAYQATLAEVIAGLSIGSMYGVIA